MATIRGVHQWQHSFSKGCHHCLLIVALTILLATLLPQSLSPTGSLRVPSASPRIAHAGGTSLALKQAAKQAEFNQLPISFEPNVGQADASVAFLAHMGSNTLMLTCSEALFTLRSSPSPSAASPSSKFNVSLLRDPAAQSTAATPPAKTDTVGMQWLGANAHPQITGEDLLLNRQG